MPKQPKSANLAEMVKLYIRRREAGKRNYSRADALFDLILKEMKVGQSVAGWKLVNNYEAAGKNKLFRPAGVSLLELIEDKSA